MKTEIEKKSVYPEDMTFVERRIRYGIGQLCDQNITEALVEEANRNNVNISIQSMNYFK